MILERKRVSRRTFLRGCGVAMSLPLLDVMEKRCLAAVAAPPKRAAFFYVPNGFVQSAWHPEETGPGFALSPTLEPLAGIREKVSLFTKLDRIKAHGTDAHAQAGTCWLSSATPEELSPAGYPLKRTLDQIIAREAGKATAFRSLELSCNSHQDSKESVYFDNISWYGPGHMAPSMKDPGQVFDRLFRVEARKPYSSVLDLVLADARSLERQLGRKDRGKLEEYMDSVRSVELQIRRIQSRQREIEALELEKPTAPVASLRRDEYIQIMGDLMILAFETDLTRVATIMVAPERWETPQTVHGVFDKPILHHSMSHRQRWDPLVRKDLEKLDRFHIEQFAKIAAKMDAITEGDGTLLDHSLFILGSGLSRGDVHVQTNLPIVIAGSGGGAIRSDRHERYSDGTPVANLWLSIAQIMGVPTDRFADSTGPLERLLA